MENKTVTVEAVKKDLTGFKATDGNWYNNKFKTFNVTKGQTVKIELNDKGFLESTEVINEAPIKSLRQEQEERAEKEKAIGIMVSYAKDLAVADKIPVEQIGDYVRGFMALREEFLKEDYKADNNTVFNKTKASDIEVAKSIPQEDLKEEDLI